MILVLGSWQSLAVRGCAAILFGIAALIWPDLTLWALVVLFGAWMLVDGVFALWAAITGQERERRWLLLVEGIAGITAGIITFVWPDITALALLYLIAAWALVTGVLKLVAAVQRQIKSVRCSYHLECSPRRSVRISIRVCQLS